LKSAPFAGQCCGHESISISMLNSSGVLGCDIIGRIYFWNPGSDESCARRIPSFVARRNSFADARASSVDAVFMDVVVPLYKRVKGPLKHLGIFRILRYLALHLLPLSRHRRRVGSGSAPHPSTRPFKSPGSGPPFRPARKPASDKGFDPAGSG
jgi:hypothetical protein